GRHRDRGPGRDRHVVHEPLRLSRSRVGLDRREGLGPWLHAIEARLRLPDASEVLPFAYGDLKASTMWNAIPLKGNWNYPTAIRFGAGRIHELPLACEQASIKRPLLVTDPGL